MAPTSDKSSSHSSGTEVPPPSKRTEEALADHLRAEASKQMAIRHASAVAAASIEKKLAGTTSTGETVRLTRQLTEFQKCSLQSELAFLEALNRMTNEQKLQTLFMLFDSDGSGTVSSQEMARCLKKMDTGKTFSQSLDAAVLSIHAFDTDGDGNMDIHEFADFVEDLVHSLRCNFEDLAQFLTLRVAFAESGSAILDDAIVALVQDSTNEVPSVENFNDAVVEVRMMLLFQMMDWKGSGTIMFEDVVKSLFHVTVKMDEIPRKTLLMCDDNTRKLDYSQYMSLILNVVAAGSLNFHDVANSMTLSVCKNDVTRTDLSDLFITDDMYKTAVEEHNKGTNPSKADLLDALQYGRLNRLFALWDLDHSGEIDLGEFVLGMRKFHEAKEVDKTLEESIDAMLSFDKDADQRLDLTEFATLICQFAKAARIPLHEFIDFMVVTSAVKDNSQVERAYIDSVKIRALEQLKAKNTQGGISVGSSTGSSNGSIGALWKNLRGGSFNNS